ncbi:MAG: hypothetical protein HYY18_00600 [Planctomycetes bacterium]|nr:hypothetical protein [Planctomycetota bacterium]
MRRAHLAVAFLLAATARLAAEEAPPVFEIEIRDGAPRVGSTPKSLELVTGWKVRCAVEVANADRSARSLRLGARGRVRIVAEREDFEVDAGGKRRIEILLQTLGPDDHRLEIAVACGDREALVSVPVAVTLHKEGVVFGLTEHFELEGAIASVRGEGPSPRPVPGKDKDLSHLTVAPDRAAGERVLADMRVMQELGFPSGKLPGPDPEAWRAFDRAADPSDLARLLQKHGGKPLYCTEFGGYRLPREADAEQQRRAALALLRNGCLLAHQGFRGVHYYELFDWGNSLTWLVRSADGHRSLGFEAFRRLASALAGATPREPDRISRFGARAEFGWAREATVR